MLFCLGVLFVGQFPTSVFSSEKSAAVRCADGNVVIVTVFEDFFHLQFEMELSGAAP